jgi:hypothetical protein
MTDLRDHDGAIWVITMAEMRMTRRRPWSVPFERALEVALEASATSRSWLDELGFRPSQLSKALTYCSAF